MATRTWPFQPVNGAPVVGSALSGAVAATVLTYTVPAGRSAMLDFAGVANFSGAPTVAVKVTIGGTTVVLQSGSAAFNIAPRIALNAADTCTLVVTGTVAASTFDGFISATEFPVA